MSLERDSTDLYIPMIYPETDCMAGNLAQLIAGEVTLSDTPGLTIKKWREIFDISQHELARHLGVSASVISDYESGRRKSPGIHSIRKIVNAFLEYDRERGGEILKRYGTGESGFIYAIREFAYGKSIENFMEAVGAEIISGEEHVGGELHGYTVIDSMRAITRCEAVDFIRIYGWSTARALIFTGIQRGRSPMVAIRAHPMKPRVVAYHQPHEVDELAIELAKLEKIVFLKIDTPLGILMEQLKDL